MTAPAPAALRRRGAAGRRAGQRRRDTRLGLLLVAPAFAVIALLVLYPSLRSITGSFQRYELLNPDRGFNGVANYRTVLGETGFQQAVANTAAYLVVITVGVLLVGLVMAVWLQSIRGPLRAVALVVVVLPWSVPGTVAGVLWSFILNPTGTGLLNAALTSAHLIDGYRTWLNTPVLGLVLIGTTVVWGGAPLGAVILLAGLEGVPTELYESSTVDGAGRVRRFVSITLPLLRPAIAIVLVNAVVLAVGLFDQVYVLVGLDPSSLTVAGSMYLYAFRDFDFGLGFAASVIATVATALISAVYLRFVYREVEY